MYIYSCPSKLEVEDKFEFFEKKYFYILHFFQPNLVKHENYAIFYEEYSILFIVFEANRKV